MNARTTGVSRTNSVLTALLVSYVVSSALPPKHYLPIRRPTSNETWVSKSENKSISATDVNKVLGKEHVARVAIEANIPEDEAADVLAQAIPAAVDHVTPEGRVPDDADVDRTLEQPAAY